MVFSLERVSQRHDAPRCCCGPMPPVRTVGVANRLGPFRPSIAVAKRPRNKLSRPRTSLNVSRCSTCKSPRHIWPAPTAALRHCQLERRGRGLDQWHREFCAQKDRHACPRPLGHRSTEPVQRAARRRPAVPVPVTGAGERPSDGV